MSEKLTREEYLIDFENTYGQAMKKVSQLTKNYKVENVVSDLFFNLSESYAEVVRELIETKVKLRTREQELLKQSIEDIKEVGDLFTSKQTHLEGC